MKPTTPTGQATIEEMWPLLEEVGWRDRGVFLDAILAIEAEARQQERERIAEGVGALENLESTKRYPHGYPPNWPFVIIRRGDVLNVICRGRTDER